MRLTGHPLRIAAAVLVFCLALAGLPMGSAQAHQEGKKNISPLPDRVTEVMQMIRGKGPRSQQLPAVSGGAPCVDGMATIYPCNNIDLEAFVPLADMGGTFTEEANDIWGWTDAASGREFALFGMTFGTAFVEVTDPKNPVYIGDLHTHGDFGSNWRDIKTYADHAFIVSEASLHGMQVFDLSQLLSVTAPPVVFDETAHYDGIGSAHNVAINESTGFAYAVGVGEVGQCGGGLHMIDITTPTSPAFAGCFSSDGYTHDTQCVTYAGPDVAYTGREICLSSNEDTVTITDVTDKTNPVQVSRTPYPDFAYTHQGWLTDDHAHFLVDDELDEFRQGHTSRTRVFDVSDLDAPTLVGLYDSVSPAIDHNLYVKGNHSYQAHYRGGLRVLDITGVQTADLTEVGFFDVWPDDDSPEFNGAWSVYPYFDSGTVIVSGIEQGLFVLRPQLDGPVAGRPGDVNCTIDLTLLDARLIALYSIDVPLVPNNSCPIVGGEIHLPAADVDGNGNVSLLDARLVAQCSIDVANALCPL